MDGLSTRPVQSFETTIQKIRTERIPSGAQQRWLPTIYVAGSPMLFIAAVAWERSGGEDPRHSPSFIWSA